MRERERKRKREKEKERGRERERDFSEEHFVDLGMKRESQVRACL